MVRDERFPNFFVIGVSKSGTTSLYDVLRQHPQVALSTVKEPSFFSDDDHYEKGLDWYLETQFSHARGFPARGEMTPRYLYWGEKVAPRIHAACGDQPRFIAVFRDPVARAYSAYWHVVRLGVEPLSFEDGLAQEEERLRAHPDLFDRQGKLGWLYYRAGLYAEQLKIYFELFPRDSFQFFLTEDLRDDFRGTMKKIFTFLRVDPNFEPASAERNAASMPRSRRIDDAINKTAWYKEIFKRVIPLPMRHRLRKTLSNLNQSPFDYPPMNPETKKMLREKYRPSIRQLESLLQRDLSHWMKE